MGTCLNHLNEEVSKSTQYIWTKVRKMSQICILKMLFQEQWKTAFDCIGMISKWIKYLSYPPYNKHSDCGEVTGKKADKWKDNLRIICWYLKKKKKKLPCVSKWGSNHFDDGSYQPGHAMGWNFSSHLAVHKRFSLFTYARSWHSRWSGFTGMSTFSSFSLR